MLFKFSFLVFVLSLSACGPKSSTPSDADKVGIKDCPVELSKRLEDYLPYVYKIKILASELKSDNDKYPFNELTGMITGDPVGFAQLHCQSDDEIMKFTEEKCSHKGSEVSIKEAKKQCDSLNRIYGIYNNKIKGNQSPEKPSQLTGDLHTHVMECINEITTTF